MAESAISMRTKRRAQHKPTPADHRAYASPNCRMSLQAWAEPPLYFNVTAAIFGHPPSIFDRKPRSKVEIPLPRDCRRQGFFSRLIQGLQPGTKHPVCLRAGSGCRLCISWPVLRQRLRPACLIHYVMLTFRVHVCFVMFGVLIGVHDSNNIIIFFSFITTNKSDSFHALSPVSTLHLINCCSGLIKFFFFFFKQQPLWRPQQEKHESYWCFTGLLQWEVTVVYLIGYTCSFLPVTTGLLCEISIKHSDCTAQAQPP